MCNSKKPPGFYKTKHVSGMFRKPKHLLILALPETNSSNLTNTISQTPFSRGYSRLQGEYFTTKHSSKIIQGDYFGGGGGLIIYIIKCQHCQLRTSMVVVLVGCHLVSCLPHDFSGLRAMSSKVWLVYDDGSRIERYKKSLSPKGFFWIGSFGRSRRCLWLSKIDIGIAASTL